MCSGSTECDFCKERCDEDYYTFYEGSEYVPPKGPTIKENKKEVER